jgi:hypothetical protein
MSITKPILTAEQVQLLQTNYYGPVEQEMREKGIWPFASPEENERNRQIYLDKLLRRRVQR